MLAPYGSGCCSIRSVSESFTPISTCCRGRCIPHIVRDFVGYTERHCLQSNHFSSLQLELAQHCMRSCGPHSFPFSVTTMCTHCHSWCYHHNVWAAVAYTQSWFLFSKLCMPSQLKLSVGRSSSSCLVSTSIFSPPSSALRRRWSYHHIVRAVVA